MSQRAKALADRLEQGARELTSFAQSLTDAQWKTRVPVDCRTVGVVVHHVASMYPIEIELTRTLAKGEAIVGVTWDVVKDINAKHAAEYRDVTKAEALELLRANSAAAAAAIRAFSDAELDRAANVSLYEGAPLTTQFFIEDHAMRHSFHHLGKVRLAVGRKAA
jgi:hypothetical protein